MTRGAAEPVAPYDPQKLDRKSREILAYQSYTLPPAFYERARNLPTNSERRFQIAKEVLFAKVMEQGSRAGQIGPAVAASIFGALVYHGRRHFAKRPR